MVASQLAYFAGYAMWTYLTLPFSPIIEAVECEEIEPWSEDGETWRAVKVSFPKSYVTHSSEQILYFDKKGLICRQDYAVEIGNGGTAAHYLYDHKKYGGIIFPTRRRISPRGSDCRVDKKIGLMAADLSDFEFIEEPISSERWSVDTCD